MPTLPASLPVLTVMAIVPLAGALLLWLVPPLRRLYARAVGLVFSLAVLVLGLWALSAFDLSQAGTVQLADTHSWIPTLRDRKSVV